MQALKEAQKTLVSNAPSAIFPANLDVEYVISFRYANGGQPAQTGDSSTPEEQLEKLLHTLDLAGLRTVVRDGGDGTLLIFTRIRSEKKLLGEIYRSRVRDWLHGIRPAAPEKETQQSIEKEPLTDGERLRLVYSLITLPNSEGGAGITPKQGEWNLVQSIFALHDHDFNKKWLKDWSTKWLIGPQDLKIIRDRFGEKIAFYFAFIQWYFIALTVPAAIGLFAYIFLPAYSSFFAICNCLWSVLFVEYWKRQEIDLAVQWGVRHCSTVQRKRAEFQFDAEATDPVTGEKLRYFPAYKRLMRQLIQVPFALFAASCLAAIIAGVFSIEIFLVEVYDGPLKMILKFLPTVLLSVFIPIVSTILTNFATRLTEFENYENQDSYEAALTQKIFVLNFITGYFPLFLTAFVYVPFGEILVPYLDVLNVTVQHFGHDEKYTTSDTGFQINPSRLKAQMIYFVVTAQVVGFVLETILPQVKRTVFKKAKEFDSRRKGIDTQTVLDPPEEKKFLDRVRHESELEEYDVTVDLREMCMQFGYLTLFSPIWPVTAVSFLINNLVEIRGDAAKICMEMQRPIPNRADSIGPWLHNLSFLTWLGSISSAALVYMFSSAELEGGPPKDLTLPGLLLSVLLSEHIYFGARYLVSYAMSKIQSTGLETERKEKFMVRKRYLEESFGMESELIREEAEKTGGEYTGVGGVSTTQDGRPLDDGQLSEKFWRSQSGWKDSVDLGVKIIDIVKSRDNKKKQ
ncbi:Anoctamin-10 [Arthrobotrys entomopaga]|nr:Anoctamin-10 [Arthrobotrys entomopaga]